jgi:hypothetical protein
MGGACELVRKEDRIEDAQSARERAAAVAKGQKLPSSQSDR